MKACYEKEYNKFEDTENRLFRIFNVLIALVAWILFYIIQIKESVMNQNLLLGFSLGTILAISLMLIGVSGLFCLFIMIINYKHNSKHTGINFLTIKEINSFSQINEVKEKIMYARYYKETEIYTRVNKKKERIFNLIKIFLFIAILGLIGVTPFIQLT